MGDFIKINSTTIILGGSIPVISLLSYFASKYISYHLEIRKNKISAYRIAFDTFKSAFTVAIQQIETGDTDVELAILGEFPKHEAAVLSFIDHLKGNRRGRFQNKWDEYKNIYQQLKNNYTPFVAIFSHYQPQDILTLIHELIHIAKIKQWLQQNNQGDRE